MTNGVFPCHVSAYKSYMPLTFDGGASSLCKSLFTPGDFISRSWNGCILVQKTVATQSVDYSCLFRVMSGNARITLMVRTGGAVYLALRSSSGDVQRICQTTAVPTLGNVMHIGYSWDGSRLALSVYDTTAKTLVQVVESSTNVTSLPAWTEEDGIYVGNRADLSLPYKGNIYGGTFGYGVALSGASMAREAAAGNMAFGTRFIIHPQVMGLRGTGIIREPNHHDITVLNPDKTAFWNSNVPSSVIQEWWRFIPTIADIPQGTVVLDTDGVVKKCRYVFRNDGTDYINLGRPTHLISLLSPGTSSKTMAIVRPTNVQDGQSIVAIAGSSVAEKQMQLSIYQLFFEGYSCGAALGKLAANDCVGLFFNLAIVNSGATARIELNKSVYGVAQMPGQSVYSGSIYIGGRTDGISTNFNGDTAFVAFYDGNGSLVDAFDPNRNDLWDGGPTGYTVMGYPFTVTDGAPTGCRAKALVPVSML